MDTAIYYRLACTPCRTPENEDLNQYWYSAYTIKKISEASQIQGIPATVIIINRYYRYQYGI